jgi:hypothetical protein
MGQTSLATMGFYIKGKHDGCHESSTFGRGGGWGGIYKLDAFFDIQTFGLMPNFWTCLKKLKGL